jgi:hypothetical protein
MAGLISGTSPGTVMTHGSIFPSPDMISSLGRMVPHALPYAPPPVLGVGNVAAVPIDRWTGAGFEQLLRRAVRICHGWPYALIHGSDASVRGDKQHAQFMLYGYAEEDAIEFDRDRMPDGRAWFAWPPCFRGSAVFG